MIEPKDIKIISLANFQDENVELIAQNTKNTWQADRSQATKIADTKLGKLAESAVQYYFQQRFPDLEYLPYDDFRTDGFKKHAPFDGLLFGKQTPNNVIFDIVSKINAEIEKGFYGQISDALKTECKEAKIYLTEIKSTRVGGRHYNQGILDISKILSDDFLDYPKHIRTDRNNSIKNMDDYISFVQAKNQKSMDEILKEEIQHLRHVYVRVYIDEKANNALIIGYISGKNLVLNGGIKRMPQKNKSEAALYIAQPLKDGAPIKAIEALKVWNAEANLEQEVEYKPVQPVRKFNR